MSELNDNDQPIFRELKRSVIKSQKEVPIKTRSEQKGKDLSALQTNFQDRLYLSDSRERLNGNLRRARKGQEIETEAELEVKEQTVAIKKLEAERDEAIKDHKVAIEKLRTKHHEDIMKKDSDIQELHKKNTQRHYDIHYAADVKIASLKNIISGRDDEIASLHKIIAERDDEIDKFLFKVDDYEREIYLLQKELESKDGGFSSK